MRKIKKIVDIIKTDLTKSRLSYFEYDMKEINIPTLKSDVRDIQIDTIMNDNDHSDEVKEKRQDIEDAEEYLRDSSPPGTLGAAMNRSKVSIGGVKLKTKEISLDDKYENEMVVYRDLKSRMIKHGIDLQDTFKIDLNGDCRKNISKIIRCGSLIATEGRIGPGNFILMNQKMITHFGSFITKKDNDMMLTTFNIIIDPTITDKTVIGRINKTDQAGIKFVTDGVNYSIEEIGNRCCNQYVTLDVIYVKE